ncbi:MAG: aldo/keto reductase [Crocosphaera sp.]|uniref:Aldo-keto reductase family 1 member B10 n=3 Tax=Crocosphaera watsonii TaxID=263511 RepID=T2JS97_CROWT|nr:MULTISPECIES: aldo/keto reductase [Crocosphaera]EHJ11388.1 aldo/keto reductase family protein [Crocosphaera watsonii WH 0003]MCH2246897.1 aldo/keto reductase [Crocosphaera sp.]CCQ59318.1 oxidoreductase of aldo/keto reductase family,subgroup 1 [Crocosphaera watsonii WH 0005]CCQ67904.1 Aldo-keto reductase family 1 member B10 [Crocosphaera watsonii WH 0402]
MKTLTFNNGNTIPQFGLGTWKSKPGEVKNAVKYALSIGYKHIDCAAIYGNETEVGEALKESFADNVVQREDIFITSKLWNNRHKKDDVVLGLKQTLKDLELDYLDLYLIHWPVAFKPEVIFPEDASGVLSLSEVPLIETWQGMEQAVNQGLVKNIGVSNFSIKKIDNIISNCSIKPAMNQVECHPYLQQDELLASCQQNDIVLTAYSPLGSKDRPDSLKQKNEPTLLENEVIKNIAEKYQVTTAQILIKWAIERGTVVIPKSVSPERIKQNFEAQNINLDTEDMEQIKTLNRNYRYVDGSFFAIPNSSYTVESIWG